MQEKRSFDYFYKDEVEKFLVEDKKLKSLPILVEDKKLKSLPNVTKLLYAYLLEQTSYSRANGCIDEEGYAYIVIKVETITHFLGCSHEESLQALAEINDEGLITVENLSDPAQTIYVKTKIICVKIHKHSNESDAKGGEAMMAIPQNKKSEYFRGYDLTIKEFLMDRRLSLKAKGMLAQLLFLPPEWNFTIKRLSGINRDQADAVSTALNELENLGYIKRERERDEKGRVMATTKITFNLGGEL